MTFVHPAWLTSYLAIKEGLGVCPGSEILGVSVKSIPGEELIAVPDPGRHEDAREGAGQEQDEPGAFAVLVRAKDRTRVTSEPGAKTNPEFVSNQ